MTATQTPERDYVPVDGGKSRMSRARKGLIGLLVVGAISGAAGGGTFATFTASTDNRSGADPFESENNMVLANTVLTGDDGTVCRSDEAPGDFTEENIAADAVRCEVLYTAADLAALTAGDEIVSYVALENLSDDGVDGIEGTLMWGAVDEFFAGCVGFDDTTDMDGADDTLFTDDDDYILAADGDYETGTLCDNIAVTIQEVGFGGIRADDETLDYATHLAGNNYTPVTDPGSECVFPADTALCATSPASDQLASLLPASFNPVSEIDATMEPREAETDYTGVRIFRISATLVGDVICDTDGSVAGTDNDDLNDDGIVDETGFGCSNGADGYAAFTLRWVLQEN